MISCICVGVCALPIGAQVTSNTSSTQIGVAALRNEKNVVRGGFPGALRAVVVICLGCVDGLDPQM